MAQKFENELIFCVVNSGFAENVMDAARSAGASGGTILAGHGTANQIAEKLHEITIQPEKEIVMIIVPSEIKDKVMTAINNSNNLASASSGIIFSLPLTHTIGLS